MHNLLILTRLIKKRVLLVLVQGQLHVCRILTAPTFSLTSYYCLSVPGRNDRGMISHVRVMAQRVDGYSRIHPRMALC